MTSDTRVNMELVDFEDGKKALITEIGGTINLSLPSKDMILSKRDAAFLISYLSRVVACSDQ